MAYKSKKMNSPVQYGGEGMGEYSKPKLVTGEGVQHGGEMKEKVTTQTSQNEGINMYMSGEAYCGPGKYISVQTG